MQEIELFVPGRLSLLGGLSDLKSPYLSINKELTPGTAIACGINKGIYAKVSKSENIYFEMNGKNISWELDKEKLLQEAKSGSFYSYLVGTIYYIIEKYEQVKGITIKITKMDLPIKKGLASSAAICVLIAKAYNELYNLNLSIEKIKEIAYEGEHIALSQCGRLDQICALGKSLVKIDFYENTSKTTEIKVKKELNFVIADLNGKKNTKKIMRDLNNCFPFMENENQKVVYEMMGEKNRVLVENAKRYIENGDIISLGKTLNEAQILIDNMSIVCSEFKAPILHKTLNDEYIKSLSYGGKGIGSGGDGSIQILAKDKKSQELLIDYFKNTLKMEAFKVDIK